MKKLGYFLTLIFVAPSWGQAPSVAKKYKVPHNHQAAMGGQVLMLGDDHVEVLKAKKGSDLIEIHVSDKFREKVALSKVKLQLATKTGDKVEPLDFVVSDKDPAMALVKIPKSVLSENTQLEVRLVRIEKIKGYVSTDSPGYLNLVTVLNSKSMPPDMDHSKHGK